MHDKNIPLYMAVSQIRILGRNLLGEKKIWRTPLQLSI